MAPVRGAGNSDGSSELEQTAAFIPKGLFGLAYWYALYPFHSWIFSGLVRAVARRAEGLDTSPSAEQDPPATGRQIANLLPTAR